MHAKGHRSERENPVVAHVMLHPSCVQACMHCLFNTLISLICKCSEVNSAPGPCMPKDTDQRVRICCGARNVTSLMCTHMHALLSNILIPFATTIEVHISTAVVTSAKGQSDDRIPSGRCTCCYIPHVYTHACIAWSVCRKYSHLKTKFIIGLLISD